jgi:hypothetical protein
MGTISGLFFLLPSMRSFTFLAMIRAHLQNLDSRTRKVQTQSNPSNAETKQLDWE